MLIVDCFLNLVFFNVIVTLLIIPYFLVILVMGSTTFVCEKFVTRTICLSVGRIGGADSRWWQMGNKRLKN